MTRKDSIKSMIDETLDESFPASDPPSWMSSATHMDDHEFTEQEQQNLAADENQVKCHRKTQEGADPAAAPAETDQEAGGTTSPPNRCDKP